MAGESRTIIDEYQCTGFDINLKIWAFFSGLINDVPVYNHVLTPEEIAALVQ